MPRYPLRTSWAGGLAAELAVVVTALVFLVDLNAGEPATIQGHDRTARRLTFSLVADQQALQIGKRTAIRLRPDTRHVVEDSLVWSTTNGTLLGSGSDVTFRAPSQRGWSLVQVTGVDAGRQFRATVPIFAYRHLVILKADDLRQDDPRWGRFVDVIQGRNLRAAIGIIAETLDSAFRSSLEQQAYYDWILSVRLDGRFEFFCHGFDHTDSPPALDPTCVPGPATEFHETPYAYQAWHMATSIALAQEHLGFDFQTFGAPFNRHDCNTLSVIDATPEIEVWLSGNDQTTKLNVPWTLEAEYPQWWEINPAHFQAQYAADPMVECFTVELHPAAWFAYGSSEDLNFALFEQLLDFLTAQESTFILPMQFHQLRKNGVVPLDGTLDSDGDGIPDPEDGLEDDDGDGIPNLLDPDLGGSGGTDDPGPYERTEVPRASVLSRNGRGVNTVVLSSASRPVIGGTWRAKLDCRSFGNGVAAVSIRILPNAGRLTLFGQELIGGSLLLRTTRVFSGNSSLLTWSIPNDASLVGQQVHAQGLCRSTVTSIGPETMGKRAALSNALDLTLGL